MELRALVLLLGVLAGLGALLAIGTYRWRTLTASLVERLRQPSPTARPSTFSGTELRGLPPPVVRYLGAALPDAQPIIRYARLTQRGQFLVRPTPTGWRPFVATEHFATQPCGFIWDARVRAGLGLSIWVRDAFIQGTGSMLGRLMGLWRVVAVENTPEIAAGALHRYLAEAVWFPTALLPSQGVVWSALGDDSARAALTVAATTVSLDFHFGDDGMVRRVFTAARARDVRGRGVPTPWQGRFSRYEVRGGLRIPLAGEVEWLLPEGPQLYWRGELTTVAYEYESGAEATLDGPRHLPEGPHR